MPLLVDLPVPFGADGHIDLGAARALLLWLVGKGFDGVALACGEFLHLDRREKEKLLELSADVLTGKTILFPIWDTTPGAVARLGHAAIAAGAVPLLPPPLMAPMSDDAALYWFSSVAHHVGAPILAWHHRGLANGLNQALLNRLAADGGVAGWLDGSGDLHRVRRQAGAWPGVGWASLDEGYSPSELDALSQTSALAGGITRVGAIWPDLVGRAWRRAEPALFEALAHRIDLIERAGGTAAVKKHMGLGARLPLAWTVQPELDRLPRCDFPR